jgi:iron(III) transport system substrate-binding protein
MTRPARGAGLEPTTEEEEMMKAASWVWPALAAMALALPAMAQPTTPEMVAAAEKEGKVVWYVSVDVKVAEGVAKLFRAEYPKIPIEVERAGSERVFQRLNQEYQSNIKNVDVVNSSDASHFLFWKQQGWLAKHTPPDVQKFAPQYKDADGTHAVWRATLSVAGYNTTLVPEKDAPKSYADLLDPKWKGKMAKSHPNYSGTSLTGTYALTKALGWDYLEKLSKQGVQQLQSTTATPKSIASGERAVMVDGNEYNMFIELKNKSPVKIIYPAEGTPFVTSPSAVMAQAPHPNAARVLQNFIFTPKVQQFLVNEGGLRSLHPDTKEPADRTPLAQIKLLPDDPVGMFAAMNDIKKKYTALFGN